MAMNDEKLRELCMAGTSNKDIAIALGCKVEEVYARRSALGITIPKCKQVGQTSIRTDQRTSIEIENEIRKVEKARSAAILKTKRCDDRLAELQRELHGQDAGSF